MDSLEQLKNHWDENKGDEATHSLSKKSIEKIIAPRIKKERKIIMEYFWTVFVYQIIIYSLGSHLIVRFWGDVEVMLLCTSGVLLYIPFNIILMRKYKAIGRLPVKDIQTTTAKQIILLSDFFRFKKRFDLISVPLTCLIIVIALFKLYSKAGIEHHLIAGSILFFVWLSAFITAIYFENKKRFKEPLKKLELILKDLKYSKEDV